MSAEHDDRAWGERRSRRWVDVEPEAEEAFSPSGEDVDRPALQSLVAGDGGGLMESGAEAGEGPVDRCEQDLDAVVDAVLEQEQRDANGGKTEPPFGEIDDRGCDEDGRAGEDADDGDAEHQRDGAGASFPPRRERFCSGHVGEFRHSEPATRTSTGR